MYHQIHRDIKCSECGAMNNTATVTRNEPDFLTSLKACTYRQCLSCGHEKLLNTVTHSSTGVSTLTVTATRTNEPEIF